MEVLSSLPASPRLLGKEVTHGHLVSDGALAPFIKGPPSYVTGMAGAIHFLSDVLAPETSRFPAFELGSSQLDKKVQND